MKNQSSVDDYVNEEKSGDHLDQNTYKIDDIS